MERDKVIFPRPTTGSLPGAVATLLIVGAGILLSGCRAPFYSRQTSITVYQYGFNEISSEVLKETAITPTVKASLK
jgi:hypothetical protein